MTTQQTFCTHCGQPASSHPEPCTDEWVTSEKLSEDGVHLRCPVAGCAFKMTVEGRTGPNIESTFYSHLEWHEREGPKMRLRRPGQPVASTGTEAWLEGADGDIDWHAYEYDCRQALKRLPTPLAKALASGFVRLVRSLEGVQW